MPVICMLTIAVFQVIADEIFTSSDRFQSLTRMEGDIDPEPMNLDDAILMMLSNNYSVPDRILFSYDNEEVGVEERDILSDNLPYSPLYTYEYTELLRDANELLQDSLEDLADIDDYNFPYFGSIKVEDIEEREFNYIVQYEETFRITAENVGLLGQTNFCLNVSRNSSSESCEWVTSPSLMEILHNIYMLNMTNGLMSVRSKSKQFPFKQEEFVFEFLLDLRAGMLFYPVILLLVLPVILYSLVVEKESGLRELNRLMGLKERNFLVATYCFEFFWYVLTAILLVVMGLILGHKYFHDTSHVVMFVTLLGCGFHVVSLSFFLSTIIRKSFMATISGYIISLFAPMAGILLNQNILLDGEWAWKWVLIISPLPITDIMWKSLEKCQDFQPCLQIEDMKQTDFLITLIMLYADAVIYFLLGLYLEEVVPKTWGRRRGALFFLKPFWKCFMNIYGFSRIKKPEKKVKVDKNEEDDVRDLRIKIHNDELEEDERGIVIQGLTKIFGRGKRKNIAVNNVHFNVNKNEIFGLLGPNGAGKTTTCRILCGLFPQSKGKATIYGKDIEKDMKRIRKSMGFCPQFDRLWGDLTPTEHLLFYSRLKGVSPLFERRHVSRILKVVGLKKDRRKMKGFFDFKFWCGLGCRLFRCFCCCCLPQERLAKQLSGGMKRRLSIAMSLVGDPKVIILDEPCTGLDPKNQREIWKVIFSEKKNRSIILTTHSMEEAEALSDRIGIMCYGKLVAVGNSLHLKQKYGNGYMLNLKFGHEENIRRTSEEFLVNVLADHPFIKSNVIKQFGKNISYELRYSELAMKELEEERNNLDDESEGNNNNNNRAVEGHKLRLSAIFRNLEYFKKQHNCVDFEFQQTTLEDVFLNVISINNEKYIMEKVNTGKKKSKKNQDDSSASISSSFPPEQIDTVSHSEEEEEVVSANRPTEVEIEIVSDPVEQDSQEQEQQQEEELQEEENEGHEVDEEEKKNNDDVSYSSDASSKTTSSITTTTTTTTTEGKKKKVDDSYPTPLLNMLLTPILQIRLLMWKNCLLFCRQWKTSCVLILAPFVGVICLRLIAFIIENSSEDFYTHPEIFPIQKDKFLECQEWEDKECIPFIYTTNGYEFGDLIMNDLIQEFDIEEGKDYLEFRTSLELEDFVRENENVTVSGIAFENGTSIADGEAVYTLYYNSTKDVDVPILSLKLAVDNIILQYVQREVMGQPWQSEMHGSSQGYPLILTREARNGQAEVLFSTGPLFFTITLMLTFIVALYRIVLEKEKRLRMGLVLLGMPNCPYFTSWCLTMMIISFLSTTSLLVGGYIVVLDVFIYSNPAYTFFMFYLFTISLICGAFAVSSLVNRARTALVMGFIILSLTFVMVMFVVNRDFIYLIFEMEGGGAMLQYGLQIFFSPFNFSKAFADLVYRTVRYYDPGTNEFVKNDGLWFKEIFERNSGPVDFDGDVQSSFVSIIYLFVNIILYLMLYYVGDNCLPRPGKPGCQPCFCCDSTKKTVCYRLFCGPDEGEFYLDEEGRTRTRKINSNFAGFRRNMGKLSRKSIEVIRERSKKRMQKMIKKREKKKKKRAEKKELKLKMMESLGLRGDDDDEEEINNGSLSSSSSSKEEEKDEVSSKTEDDDREEEGSGSEENSTEEEVEEGGGGVESENSEKSVSDEFNDSEDQNLDDLYDDDDEDTDYDKEIEEDYYNDLENVVKNAIDLDYPASLRLLQLKKTYRSLLGKRVRALKGVDMHVPENTIVGVLGENGAGKSTTINVVAGLVQKGSGIGLIGDRLELMDRNSYRIRKMLGVCLQENLLWDDLTAKEHLTLFSRMKWGLGNMKLAKRDVEERLKEVSLYDVRNDRSKTFSGGMKRRLNVAMSFIGQPELSLLDEITTGLDPFSKREVWKLVKKKKKETTIVLTTHSMEEADNLSDYIVILRKGYVECAGDGLELKQKYGKGYVLKFTVSSVKPEKVQLDGFKEGSSSSSEEEKSISAAPPPESITKPFEMVVRKFFPSAKLTKRSAWNYLFNTTELEELINGLEEFEDCLEEGDNVIDGILIKDYAVCFSNLEDVYLRVNKDVDESSDEEDEEEQFHEFRNRMKTLELHEQEEEVQEEHSEEEEEEELGEEEDIIVIGNQEEEEEETSDSK